MNTDEEMLNALSERIIGFAFKIHNTLGGGFMEKVYENALAHECRKAGLDVEQQKPIVVMYDGQNVGEYLADLMIEKKVIVELKAIKSFNEVHAAQCLNYLTGSGIPLCLWLNFTNRVEVKRFRK